jgi:6,7-dimethyl-8-ribityllumazine synthase
MKICIIVSNFYPKISKMLVKGSLAKLKKNGKFKITLINVPGTFEIPVLVSNLIKKYDAFIVLGCVIKGETTHFDYLCSSVFNSLTHLSVISKKPIGNGILTCNNKKQAILRADPNKKNKGGDAASAIIALLRTIKNER